MCSPSPSVALSSLAVGRSRVPPQKRDSAAKHVTASGAFHRVATSVVAHWDTVCFREKRLTVAENKEDVLHVEGGKPLNGTIKVRGAKNFVSRSEEHTSELQSR